MTVWARSTKIPVKYEGHHERLELSELCSIQLLIVSIPSFYSQTRNYLILKLAFFNHIQEWARWQEVFSNILILIKANDLFLRTISYLHLFQSIYL